MTKLVLAEKPSVARDIARVLGAQRRSDGFVEGNGYVVTWAIGHLVHFAEPNEYGGNWRQRWGFHQLPMVPNKWILTTHKNTESQYKIVARLLNREDVSEVICATDAGREGENIFRLIYEHAGCNKPIKRLWVSSLTEEAIADGFRNLKDGTEFDDLARAARARSQADWLVGLNMTRAYTVHHGALYTIGRVQTPTLALIVKRELEITQFNKAYYYEIEAQFHEGFKARYEKDKKTRIDIKAEAQRLFQKLQPEQTGMVTKVEKKTKRYRPPQLYDLINLQKDANKRFGMTAKTVLGHAQSLYEKYKLITYPRTESRHISEDMLGQLPNILRNLSHPQANDALTRLQQGHKLSKNYVDKTKLTDHHGIIPTPRRSPATLPSELRAVYNMVVTRFVSIFLPDHIVEETHIYIKIADELFKARGAVVKELGWKITEAKKKEEVPPLPSLFKGQQVGIKKLDLLEKETAPPKRFTDASLLTAMKNAGKEVEDDALAEAMKEQGLGTPATRAEIIEKLLRTRLAERRKKVLFPTDKGMALIRVADENLKSPELTGGWEQRLKDVEQGKFPVEEFYNGIVGFVSELVPQVRRAPVLSYRDERPGDKKKPSPNPVPTKKTQIQTQTQNPKGSAGLGICPACHQGSIIEGKTAYGCNRFRQGCRTTLPKEIAGKRLSAKQVLDLVDKKRTSWLKGFVDDQGTKFDARLILNDRLQIGFDREAPKKKTVELTCPKCSQGRIIEGKRGYGCNRFKSGCDFVVWKEIASKKLTKKQVEVLIGKGKTPMISGFTGKSGKKFKARLKLQNNRVTFELPDKQ